MKVNLDCKLTFNRGKEGMLVCRKYIPPCSDEIRKGAITSDEVARCREDLRIGTEFEVADAVWKKEWGTGTRPTRRGKVIAKYPHVVMLDCGTSITYVQILQQQRSKKKVLD